MDFRHKQTKEKSANGEIIALVADKMLPEKY